MFVRKLKPFRNGTGDSGKRKCYYLMDVMKFLVPFVRVNNPAYSSEKVCGSLKSDSKGKKRIEKEKSVDVWVAKKPERMECDSKEIRNCTDLLSPRENCETNGSNNLCSSIESHARKEKHMTTLDEDDRSFIEFLNLKKSKLTTEEDPRKQFLLSLLPDVRQMTDAQMRRFKRNVLYLVEDILDNAPVDSLPAYPIVTNVISNNFDESCSSAAQASPAPDIHDDDVSLNHSTKVKTQDNA